MKVAVLGSGPAGLLAAQACLDREVEVEIISADPVRRGVTGAQYIHSPIPGLTRNEPDGFVRFAFVGNGEIYNNKVYGDMTEQPRSSWYEYERNYGDGRPVGIWSMMGVLDALWARLADKVQRGIIQQHDVEHLMAVNDLVISTIPAPHLCTTPNLHTFTAVDVNIVPQAPAEVQHGMIYYSGNDGQRWYRGSRLFGHASTEYGPRQMPAQYEPIAVRLRKPLYTNCDCHPQLGRAGRYGIWDKHVLAHDAYGETLERLDALL